MSVRRKNSLKSAIGLLERAARILQGESAFGPYSGDGAEAYTNLLMAMDGLKREREAQAK